MKKISLGSHMLNHVVDQHEAEDISKVDFRMNAHNGHNTRGVGIAAMTKVWQYKVYV